MLTPKQVRYRRCAYIKFRFNETYFEWWPYVEFRRGYVGWLWFCVNWCVYKEFNYILENE